MPLKTKRWNDPVEPDDGHRLLVTRYRPRGVRKEDETWDEWLPALGPDKELHAAVYTDRSSPIPWPQYRRRYLEQQRGNRELIAGLAKRVRNWPDIGVLLSGWGYRKYTHRSAAAAIRKPAISSNSSPRS